MYSLSTRMIDFKLFAIDDQISFITLHAVCMCARTRIRNDFKRLCFWRFCVKWKMVVTWLEKRLNRRWAWMENRNQHIFTQMPYIVIPTMNTLIHKHVQRRTYQKYDIAYEHKSFHWEENIESDSSLLIWLGSDFYFTNHRTHWDAISDANLCR